MRAGIWARGRHYFREAMTMDEKRKTEILIEVARGQFTYLGIGLCAMLPPADVAGLFGGALIGVLETQFNRELACDFLRDMADELEASDGDAPAVGHA